MNFIIFLASFLVASEGLAQKAKSLGELFRLGTEISGDKRLTLRGILPFPNEFIQHPNFSTRGWEQQLTYDTTVWSLLIYVQPDLHSAYQHQQTVPYPLFHGVYLINPNIDPENVDLSSTDLLTLAQAKETQIALYEGGEWYNDAPNNKMQLEKWRYLSYDKLLAFIPDSKSRATFAEIVAKEGYRNTAFAPYYDVPAFSRRKVAGINHSDTLTDKRFRSIINKTYNLMTSGYTVVFNQRIEECIERLKQQKRRGQKINNNRYLAPLTENNLRAAFRNGKAFTALLLNPNKEIEAGVVGFTFNNVYEPDSVFGDDINKVKVVDFSLMRYLRANKIKVINTAMVTNYTESLGGYRVSEKDYLNLVHALPQNIVSLPKKSWTDHLAIIITSKKVSENYLEKHLFNDELLYRPLLVIHTSAEHEKPYLLKENKRIASMQEVLKNSQKITLYTDDGQQETTETPHTTALFNNYLKDIQRIEIEVVKKINVLKVISIGGFPTTSAELFKQNDS